MDWPNFFRGIFYSFLPKRYWQSWRPSSTVDFARSGTVSGLLESLACLYFLFSGYLHFLVIRTRQLRAASDSNEGTQLYLLVVLTLEYVVHPATLLLLFLAGEGALRAWSSFFTDEVIPSFPIRFYAFVQDRLAASKKQAEFGPELPDLFERSTGETRELRISAQKPKEGWRASIAVAVEGEFYQIARVETTEGPRPFIYRLRKLQPGQIIRGSYSYVPPRGA